MRTSRPARHRQAAPPPPSAVQLPRPPNGPSAADRMGTATFIGGVVGVLPHAVTRFFVVIRDHPHAPLSTCTCPQHFSRRLGRLWPRVCNQWPPPGAGPARRVSCTRCPLAHGSHGVLSAVVFMSATRCLSARTRHRPGAYLRTSERFKTPGHGPGIARTPTVLKSHRRTGTPPAAHDVPVRRMSRGRRLVDRVSPPFLRAHACPRRGVPLPTCLPRAEFNLTLFLIYGFAAPSLGVF